MKSFNDDIMKFIRERQAVGEQKYGKTIERDDLKPSAWAQHALEEMADGIQYAARCVETITRLEYAAGMALSEFTAQIAKLPDGQEKDRIVGIARKLVVAMEGGEKKESGPPWNEAPEWAKWSVVSPTGRWLWLSSEPQRTIEGWAYYGVCLVGRMSDVKDWTQSKQRRPE